MKTVAICTVAMLCLMALAGCHRTSDEIQIRDAIAMSTHAAEKGSAGRLVEPLSDGFDGNSGEFDRQSLSNIVRLLNLRGEHIGATTGPITFERRGDRIVATFVVTLTSGSKLLPDRVGVYEVESAWRTEARQWRCYSATWKHSI